MPSRVAKKSEADLEASNYRNATFVFSLFYAPSWSIFARKLLAKLTRPRALCWHTCGMTYVLKVHLFYLSLTERFELTIAQPPPRASVRARLRCLVGRKPLILSARCAVTCAPGLPR